MDKPMEKPMDSLQLKRGFKNGSMFAFNHLRTKYDPVLRDMVKNDPDPEGLAADVWERVTCSLSTFDEMHCFGAWLRTIVDKVRQGRRMREQALAQV